MPTPKVRADVSLAATTERSPSPDFHGRERRALNHSQPASDALEIALEHERDELDSIYRRAEA